MKATQIYMCDHRQGCRKNKKRTEREVDDNSMLTAFKSYLERNLWKITLG